MLVLPGAHSKDTCDGMTRRDVLRIGGSVICGLSLPEVLRLQALAASQPAPAANAGPGWGKAKSVILLFLQGGH